MCKYTIYHLECGHKAEDHVESADCIYYKQSSVPCDRDNPANQSRVTVRSKDRKGLCNGCVKLQRETEELKELKAIQREMEAAKKQNLAEAEERKRAAEAHEKRVEMEARADWERLQQEKEKSAAKETPKESREQEDESRSQEKKRPAKSSRDSCTMPSEFDARSSQTTKHRKSVEDTATKSSETTQKTATTSPKDAQSSSIPAPPPMPSSPSGHRAAPPSPPPTPDKKTTSGEEPKLKATDYALPAVGNQDYDRFVVNGRKFPIHESQKLKEPTTPSPPVLPRAPSHHGRLGSTIQPADIPSFSHMQGNVTSEQAARPKMTPRSSSGPKPPVPAPADLAGDNELQAKLMKRREWEAELDAEAPVVSKPAESVSANSTGSSGSDSTCPAAAESGTSGGFRPLGGATAAQMADKTDSATVMTGSVLDQKRRSGWR